MPVVFLVLATLAGAKLVAALEHGTPDDIAWTGRQVGTDEVAAVLADTDPLAARAATIAAPAVDDGWSLLDELAARATGWDRTAAVDATHAALIIARRLDGDLAIETDLPDDVLAALGARWLAIARRGDRWPDVRVGALEIAARLARARVATAEDDPGPGYDLDRFLADPDPALRRAAAELLPQPTAAVFRASLARAVIDDPDRAVVVAAAQALCADLAAGDAKPPILAALGPPGLARLRGVVTAPGLAALPPGALVDTARCLLADRSGASRAAVAALAARAPRGVRAAIARIRP